MALAERHTVVPYGCVIFTFNDYIKGVKENGFRRFSKKLWQKSYHDHIIRGEEDYLKIWNYIDTNTLKWELDKYYEK